MHQWSLPQIEVFAPGAPSDELYLEHGFFANCSLISGGPCTALIDTPMLGSLAQPLVERCARLDLAAVINTHGHLDHHLTNCLFSPGRIVQSAATVRYLQRFDDYVGYYLGLAEYRPVAAQLAQLRLVPADLEVESHSQLHVGDLEFGLHVIGAGESADSMVVVVPQLSTVFTGDLVYNGVHPFIADLQRVPGWIAALQELEKLGCRYFVPGHGAPFESSLGLRHMVAYLDRFASEVEPLLCKGLGATEIKARIDLGPFAGYAMQEAFLAFSLECLCSGYPKSAKQVGVLPAAQ